MSTGELTICMPVWPFANHAYRTGFMEAQDVLAECASVDRIELRPRASFAATEPWVARLAYHDRLGMFGKLNPGLHRVRLERDYDVFLAVCPYWRDVFYLNAIEGWDDRSRVRICWIDELWARELKDLEHWVKVLNRFDYVFVGVAGTASLLARELGRECFDLPGGIDALKFSPGADAPERVIDFYSVGRRVPAVHERVLTLAERRKLFYLFDTAVSGDSRVADPRAHRKLYASIAKRSRLFAMAPGKIDLPDTTGGQVDIGFRCFEGAAAGAVLVGHAPNSELFRQMFDWPDAVVPLAADGSDTTEVVSGLLDDHERLAAASARNVKQVLLRHDWVYRWRRMFEVAGINLPAGMLSRENRLASEAAGNAGESMSTGHPSAPETCPVSSQEPRMQLLHGAAFAG